MMSQHIPYMIFLHTKRVTACTGFGGVAGITYKTSQNHIPASQIYGLLVETLALMGHGGRTEYNSLEMLEYVMEADSQVVEVYPALPYSSEASRLVMQVLQVLPDPLRGVIEGRGLEEAFKSILALHGLVEVPKNLREYMKQTKILEQGDECSHLPLVVLPLIPALASTKEGRKLLAKMCRAGRIVNIKKFRVGIAVDRYRGGAAYRMFYAYQYTSSSLHLYTSLALTSQPIPTLEASKLMKVLGLGFKRSVNMALEQVDMLRLKRGSLPYSPRQILVELAQAASLAVGEEKTHLLLYAYDTTLLPIEPPLAAEDNSETPRRTQGMLGGTLVELRLKPVPLVYLSIFNKFYALAYGDGGRRYRTIRLAAAGSLVLLEYTSLSDAEKDLEKLRNGVSRLRLERLEVLAPKPHVLSPVHSLERMLVLNKVSKSMYNIVPVIVPSRRR